MNNEILGIYGTTRNVLKSPLSRGIILSDQEKEMAHDSDGRNADNRRRSAHLADIGIHCQGTMQKRRAEVQKSWQKLPSQAGRFEKLHRQSARARRQKIKPVASWQRTIKQFTAVSLPLLQPEKLARDKPRTNLLTFSIADCARASQWLCKMWAHGRRCAHE